MERKTWEMKIQETEACTFPAGLVEAIVDLTKNHHVFLLKGEMGAGKTSFIKEIAKALGVVDVVNSPTYALVNEYFTNKGEKIFHFDLYRLEDEELYDIGFEEYLSDDAITFIEWPEIASEFYPDNAILIDIEATGDTRKYEVSNFGHLQS